MRLRGGGLFSQTNAAKVKKEVPLQFYAAAACMLHPRVE
jgi:hypothetical protein